MSVAPTILIIDDDENVIETLKTILDDHGYLVSIARDGEEGTRKALQEQPNLVIVDMMLPKSSGLTLLERLKQHHQLSIPIIMLTGNDSNHQRAFAECLGVDRYFLKPMRPYELIQALQQLCPPPGEIKSYAQPPKEGSGQKGSGNEQ
jgi:DNA-binding response OmpR family regulator